MVRRIFQAMAAALLVAGGWSGAASAECPTGEDLDTGIVFENRLRNYTMYYTHMRLDADRTWTAWTAPVVSDPWQTEEYRGLYFLQTQRKSGKNFQDATYTSELSETFPLTDGSERTVHRFRESERGRWEDTTSITVSPHEDISIGDCSYGTKKLTYSSEILKPDGGVSRFKENRIYVPELMMLVDGVSRYDETVNFEHVRKRQDGDWFPDE